MISETTKRRSMKKALCEHAVVLSSVCFRGHTQETCAGGVAQTKQGRLAPHRARPIRGPGPAGQRGFVFYLSTSSQEDLGASASRPTQQHRTIS